MLITRKYHIYGIRISVKTASMQIRKLLKGPMVAMIALDVHLRRTKQ